MGETGRSFPQGWEGWGQGEATSDIDLPVPYIYPRREGTGPSLFFAHVVQRMNVRTLFFASYRELVGTGELFLSLAEPATVSDLLHELRERGEPFSHLPMGPVVAVNREFASLETPLADGDEVAFVPPVAGG